MTLADIRGIAFTVASIGAAFGGTATMCVVSYKVVRWFNQQIEHSKQVNSVLSQFPAIVLEMSHMNGVLLSLTGRFDAFEAAGRQRELAAAQERTRQVEERARVLLHDRIGDIAANNR